MTLTTWHYTCGHREGTVVTGTAGDRATLADAVIAPAHHCEAEGRVAVAGLFDRLPGLTLAAIPIRSTGLLLGDRRGETTLVGHGAAEPVAVAACVWLATGRPLGSLAVITGMECRLGWRRAGSFLLFAAANPAARCRSVS
ncbi:hypothetical protein [Amycolatopsis sp. DG1A-15b]|uniref:hypothetical protein n=1 Tax=Amycolatopsis sp. DG1A-15b TaxID=3052846 RepID=UPI00255BB3BE|nr:hypothetical protein [Amycolatopsis sp. DG1A-15b]WIX84876.1 hypothetical protein QRY02_26940 [Amycolatopsis sp. DG1A-15b]